MNNLATTNKIKTVKKTNSHDRPGKKGGLSVTPEIIGAMTGAAIGGLTGMMLGNKKTREKLAVVKDQAVHAAQDALETIEVKSENVADEVRQTAKDLPEKVSIKTKKSKS